MLSAVERTLRDQRLVSPGARVLVAVSGGPDSMALLHVLWELRERWQLELRVVSVDHGLRPAAAQEAAFVVGQASSLGLPSEVLALGLGGVPRPRGTGIMAFARERRFEALRISAAAHGVDVVALGHHADDQIETILFRLVRGTGLRGLGGMPYARDGFVRPLLDVRRAAIRQYLAARSIPFVEDPSNVDRRFARSRVRHDLLPLLLRENPRFGEALLGLAGETRSLGEEERDFPDAPPRSWREVLDQNGLHASRGAWTAMLHAGRTGGTKSFDLQGGRAEVRYGALVSAAGGAGRCGGAADAAETPGNRVIEGPGVLSFGCHSLKICEAARDDSRAFALRESVFDAEAVPFPWRVRAWKSGDRMRPRAGVGSRKLSDLFIDARIPRALRASLPVVVGGDETILFVPGLRPSEQGRPTSQSRRLILLETSVTGSTESSR